MWLLLPALATAGLRAEVQDATRSSPDVALVCSSARTAWTGIARLVEAIEGNEGMTGEVKSLVAARAAADLFEEDSRLTLAFWRQAGAAEVSFDSTRTPQQLAETLARLDVAGTTTIRPDLDAWIVREGDGTESRVTVEAGRAHIRDGVPPVDAVRLIPKVLVDAMPETPGCVALVHLPEGEMGALDLAVHVAFAHAEPMTFALAGQSVEAFAGIVFDPGRPREVRTPAVPDGVLVLGVGVDGIDFSRFLAGRELRRARRAQSALPITTGTTVAFFRGPTAPVVGAVLPLPEDMRARKVARRARRVARGQGLQVERTDSTHFLVHVEKGTLSFAAQEGRLLLATDPATLNAMEAAEGAPWVDDGIGGLAARYPLVFSSRVLPAPGEGPPLRLDEPFTFAVRLDPGLLSGQLVIPLTIEQLGDLAAGSRQEEEKLVLPPDEVFPAPPDEALPVRPDGP